MFCTTVTSPPLPPNPFRCAPPTWPHTNKYDPAQITMTCHHSKPPIIHCANTTVVPQENRRVHSTAVIQTLGHFALPPPPSAAAPEEKKPWSFVQPKEKKSALAIFQFLPAKLHHSHSLSASQFANHSTQSLGGRGVCICTCVCWYCVSITHTHTLSYSSVSLCTFCGDVHYSTDRWSHQLSTETLSLFQSKWIQ